MKKIVFGSIFLIFLMYVTNNCLVQAVSFEDIKTDRLRAGFNVEYADWYAIVSKAIDVGIVAIDNDRYNVEKQAKRELGELWADFFAAGYAHKYTSEKVYNEVGVTRARKLKELNIYGFRYADRCIDEIKKYGEDRKNDIRIFVREYLRVEEEGLPEAFALEYADKYQKKYGEMRQQRKGAPEAAEDSRQYLEPFRKKYLELVELRNPIDQAIRIAKAELH